MYFDFKKKAFELFDEFKTKRRLSLSDENISNPVYNIKIAISRKWFDLDQLKKDTNEVKWTINLK